MKIYVVEESFSNRGKGKDSWCGSLFIGAFDSKEKAIETIRQIVFEIEKDLAWHPTWRLEDYKEIESQIAWTLNKGYDIGTTDFVCSIEERGLNKATTYFGGY